MTFVSIPDMSAGTQVKISVLVTSLQGYVVAVFGQGLVSPDFSDPLIGREFQFQMVG